MLIMYETPINSIYIRGLKGKMIWNMQAPLGNLGMVGLAN